MIAWLLLFCTCLVAAVKHQKFNLQDDHLLYDKSTPDYETVLTPSDFEMGAQLQESLQISQGDVWDSDAMYGSTRFEGDIANPNLNASTIGLFLSGGSVESSNGKSYNAIKNRHQLWPNGRIPYTISSQYSSYSRSLIASSMQDYAEQTCIRWVPKEANDLNYVHIYPDRGCYSMVGKMGGKQVISLGSGCIQKGIIIHELMHAVGFFHEQSRTDRDDFITIMWNNIQAGMQGQFEKYGQGTIQSLGTTYDYTSIMHYGTKAFSKNGQPTMIPKQKGATIGQRNGFSKVDTYKINTLYGCPVDGAKPETTTAATTQAPTVAPSTIPPIYPSPPTTTQAPISPDQCKNTRGDCDDLARNGWCQRNPSWMKAYCPISCGFCKPAPKPEVTTMPPVPTIIPGPTSDCEDLRVDCHVLVKQRYCHLSQTFMKTYCSKSCGFCYKPPPTEIPDTTVRPTATPLPTVVTQAPMVTFIPTVSVRPPLPSSTMIPQPPTPSACKDKKHFCGHWKSAGFCEGIFMQYMKKNCPASCGLC